MERGYFIPETEYIINDMKISELENENNDITDVLLYIFGIHAPEKPKNHEENEEYIVKTIRFNEQKKYILKKAIRGYRDFKAQELIDEVNKNKGKLEGFMDNYN